MKNDVITMLKVENVSKVYRLGEIGGTTLRDELQRKWAKIRHKEDPTKKIGSKNYNSGEKFLALKDVSFQVKKGERIGIIGHNGAGKSTLLKLISRVTGPTEGSIFLNGRIASMLEVGTGFHPELTGRENIFMNGAILGMTKKEIASKIEDIIDFSEVRQFIDTPVKRYSSGMYVKLAFSVAAHLDSEIMIMDEVLAVGDVAFQNKCIKKMKEVSVSQNRTILYVSHNMKTIKELCDRVIVLEKGQIVFDGGVDEGIKAYLGINKFSSSRIFTDRDREDWSKNSDVKISGYKLFGKNESYYKENEEISLNLKIESKKEIDNLFIRFEVSNVSSGIIGSALSKSINLKEGENNILVSFRPFQLVASDYLVTFVVFQHDDSGTSFALDAIPNAFSFSISKNDTNLIWLEKYFGHIEFPLLTCERGD